MRVWKGGFMVHTLEYYNFGPTAIFETFELYIVRPVVNGRPQRPIRAHRFWPGTQSLDLQQQRQDP